VGPGFLAWRKNKKRNDVFFWEMMFFLFQKITLWQHWKNKVGAKCM